MAKEEQEQSEAVIGTGNVFEDLGYSNPEEKAAKAELAYQIQQIIENRNLTQAQAAELMGIDQPKVSDIVRGKLSRYTIDRLFRFLMLLGRTIEIHVKRPKKASESPHLNVIAPEKRGRTHERGRRKPKGLQTRI